MINTALFFHDLYRPQRGRTLLPANPIPRSHYVQINPLFDIPLSRQRRFNNSLAVNRLSSATERDRTADLSITNRLLCHLSYGGPTSASIYSQSWILPRENPMTRHFLLFFCADRPLRRRSLPLVARLFREQKKCRPAELNCGHTDFQSVALPTELGRHRWPHNTLQSVCTKLWM